MREKTAKKPLGAEWDSPGDTLFFLQKGCRPARPVHRKRKTVGKGQFQRPKKLPEVSLHFKRGRDSESLPFPTCSKVGEQQRAGWCEKGWSVGIPGRSRSIPARLFRFHQVSRDDAVGIGGLVEIDGLDSWQQGAEMVRQACACLQRVLHGATRPEKAKGASVGAYGASVVSWMFPKKT